MKKIGLVFAFLICLFFLFASLGSDSVTMKAEVPPINPLFSLWGSLEESTSYAQGTAGGTILDSNVDLSIEGASEYLVDAYVKVIQDNDSKFKGSFTLTVSASAFLHSEEGIDTKTDVPDWFSTGFTYNNNNLQVTYPTELQGQGEYSISLDYRKNTLLNLTNTELAKVRFRWKGNQDLAAGTYFSTITLKYTVP